jgi:hypothetical protein
LYEIFDFLTKAKMKDGAIVLTNESKSVGG